MTLFGAYVTVETDDGDRSFSPSPPKTSPDNPRSSPSSPKPGPTAKVVLGILLFFSFVSWVIIFAKFIRLRRVSRQSEKFVTFFRKSKRFSEVNTFAGELADTPLTTLFKAGYAELDAQVKADPRRRRADHGAAAPQGKLLIKNISGIERALERAIGVEMSRLTRSMTFLATTASACPFIGLFGTVWGIMQSFRAIGLTGSTSIAAVAPGISEALVNTAAGLAAAIPGDDLLQLLHGQGPGAAGRHGRLLAGVHQPRRAELHVGDRVPLQWPSSTSPATRSITSPTSTSRRWWT